jgi:hypothetical protein
VRRGGEESPGRKAQGERGPEGMWAFWPFPSTGDPGTRFRSDEIAVWWDGGRGIRNVGSPGACLLRCFAGAVLAMSQGKRKRKHFRFAKPMVTGVQEPPIYRKRGTVPVKPLQARRLRRQLREGAPVRALLQKKPLR